MANLNLHGCIELTQGEENQGPAETGSSNDVTTQPQVGTKTALYIYIHTTLTQYLSVWVFPRNL